MQRRPHGTQCKKQDDYLKIKLQPPRVRGEGLFSSFQLCPQITTTKTWNSRKSHMKNEPLTFIKVQDKENVAQNPQNILEASLKLQYMHENSTFPFDRRWVKPATEPAWGPSQRGDLATGSAWQPSQRGDLATGPDGQPSQRRNLATRAASQSLQ